MYHVEDLSVELVDSTFDQMYFLLTMDLSMKWNLYEHVVAVADEMMYREMLRVFVLTNHQLNIYLFQPREVMQELIKSKEKRNIDTYIIIDKVKSALNNLRAVPYDR